MADDVDGNMREFMYELRKRAQHDRGCVRLELTTDDDEARSSWREDARGARSLELGFRHGRAEDPSDRRIARRRRPIGLAGCEDDISSAGNALQQGTLQPPQKSSLRPRVHWANEERLPHRESEQQPERADRRRE